MVHDLTHYSTFAFALTRIESTLLIGRFISGWAGDFRVDFSLDELDIGCSFALIAYSTESLILDLG